MRAALLTSFLILTSGSCSTYAVQSDVPCPARPTLTPITVEQQVEIDPQVLLAVLENQLALKTYAKKLEVRANCQET